jgi:GNAT superfamily N-acetyltransferase
VAEFVVTDPREPPACDLLEAMVAELRVMYGLPEGQVGVALEVEEMARPTGGYLVGWVGEMAVAGGGLRAIGEGVGEIKRMYVHPDFRGRGLGSQLLAALEGDARTLGMGQVRLDTGPKQPDAQHLYERSGYVAIDNYNANPHASYWAEKVLA